MKRIITIIAAALALAACGTSPKTAKIENGKIENISSAEAVTLMKREQRHDKVKTVIDTQKPIVRLEAHAGKPITIDAKTFEVFVPLDTGLLLAEEADAVSEEVQMAREVRGIARETVVPLGLGGMALSDRNNARTAAVRTAEIEASAAVEMEELRSAERQASRTDPIILTLPEGGTASVLKQD